MSITNQNAKAVQLQALEMAREYIENNQEIPNEISHILFPPETFRFTAPVDSFHFSFAYIMIDLPAKDNRF